MKLRAVMFVIALLPLVSAAEAQDAAVPARAMQHHHYKLIDLGTFGGSASYFSNGFDGILNSQRTSVGWADTATPDPFPAFCFNPDCFVSHAFASRNGVMTDLGALPGGASSQAFWISANGLVVGNSQNGQLDPLIPGFPQNRAVLWRAGTIVDPGTLEGGYESLVSVVNSRGQVVGVAFNTVPDPYNGLFVNPSPRIPLAERNDAGSGHAGRSRCQCLRNQRRGPGDRNLFCQRRSESQHRHSYSGPVLLGKRQDGGYGNAGR